MKIWYTLCKLKTFIKGGIKMSSKFSGHKIRIIRKNLGMSIKELADKSQLSTGLISQIERDLVSPSVNAMTRIVAALDTTMGEFFDEDYTKQSPVVIKKETHKEIVLTEMQRKYEILSPTDNRMVEMVFMTIGKTEDPESFKPSTHEGEECGYIFSGKLTVEVDGEKFNLEEGDSIYFESTKPHRYINYYDEETVSVWAMTPPSY